MHKVLFLGPDSPVLNFLRTVGHEVVPTMDRVDVPFIAAGRFDWLVSYGYRFILRRPVLDLFPDRAVNLHISFLPWNRGADPNLWSFIDQTPKGVSIHYIDEGVDTGDVIVQRAIQFPEDATLASSYAMLQEEIQRLFCEHWPSIAAGHSPRHRQAGEGTFHRVSDRDKIAHLMTDGWNTPVAAIEAVCAWEDSAKSVFRD